jgi:hypothetical protein
MTTTLYITITPSEAADKALAGLNRLLADPSMLQAILRQAAQETLVRAYQRRFVAGQFHMVGMEKNFLGRAQPAQAQISSYIDRLQRSIGRARRAGNEKRVEQLQRQLREYDGTKEFAKKKRKWAIEEYGGGALSTGLYTPRIKKILGLITAVPTDMVSTAMMHTIGIGNLPSLDKVRTPSFAESEGRPLIRRNYMTMWRQLEFGSGIYSIAGRGPWQFGSLWYGPHKNVKRGRLNGTTNQLCGNSNRQN